MQKQYAKATELHDIDDCLHIARVHDWHIHLEADPQAGPSPVTNGHFPLPSTTVKAWIARHGGT